MASPGSEPESPASLPQAEPSDSAEVARSLKLASMLWEEGQQREAVRALQRGAAAAEEDGNDLRALTLARSAADLAAHLPASIPPPGASSPPPPVSPREAEPPSEPTVVVTVDDAGPPSSSPELTLPIVVTPPESEPVPTPAVAQPLSVRPPASTPRPASTPTPPRVAPMGRVNTPSVAPDKSPSKMPSHAINGASGFSFPVTAREVRVSVKRSALDESLFVVRPLAPGATAPAGSREAVLVFPDVDGE